MQNYMCANWKMFKTRQEAAKTAAELVSALDPNALAGIQVVILPPFTALQSVHQALDSRPGFFLGGQNFYPAQEGAFTGEISVPMLLDLGCSYVLAGHSERRHILGENNQFIARKVHFALQHELKTILCIGETQEERRQSRLEQVLSTQLQSVLQGLQADQAQGMLFIAYEPVWAIGTGEVAEIQDISQAHKLIRDILDTWLGSLAREVPILYGGSVKPENSDQIMGIDNVNGLLVGGASLNVDTFSRIVQSGCQA